MPQDGYELATPFLHGRRYFLQAGEREFAFFWPKNEHCRVRSVSETERDFERDPSRNRASNVARNRAGFAPEWCTDPCTESGSNVSAVPTRIRSTTATR